MHHAPNVSPGAEDKHLEDNTSTLIAKTLSRPKDKKLACKIRRLLINFDGIESFIDDQSDAPTSQVRSVLISSLRWPSEMRHFWVARQISLLSAFHYHTVGDQSKWNPLLVPRSKFLDENRDSETWFDEHPHPGATLTFNWLTK